LPIFLIVLVDVLGFTIVIPLLSLYAEKFGASPLVATTLVSVYATCSLIATPVIGNLSDRFGRRRLLLVSQAGTCVGFLVLASSTALWMVFVGRILDGITAGNLSIAQAYISDHTKPENRAKAFGVIGIAFGIGFMFGPGLGGVLGKYGLHVPFLVAAGLSLLSIVATATLLKNEKPGGEETKREDKHEAPLPAGRRPGAFDIDTYVEYFRRPRLGNLYLQFFLFTFAFSCFTSGFALFAERRFTTTHDMKHVDGTCQLAFTAKVDPRVAEHAEIRFDSESVLRDRFTVLDETKLELSPSVCPHMQEAKKISVVLPWTAREVGLLFTFSGFLGILLQGGLIGRLVKRYGETKLVLAGFIAASAAYVLLGLAYTIAMIMLVAVISAFGNGVLRPVVTSLITQVAGRREQGVALGISGSLSSFAMMLAPPTGGFLLDHGHLLAWALVPATTAAIGFFVAAGARPSTPASTAPADELSSGA